MFGIADPPTRLPAADPQHIGQGDHDRGMALHMLQAHDQLMGDRPLPSLQGLQPRKNLIPLKSAHRVQISSTQGLDKHVEVVKQTRYRTHVRKISPPSDSR